MNNLNEEQIALMTDEDVARLPETFGIEYLTTGKLKEALTTLGAKFIRSAPIDSNSVYMEGEMPDGTIIRIEAVKGKDYESPKQLAEEIRARIKKEAEGKQAL
jgi:hypothetical protein